MSNIAFRAFQRVLSSIDENQLPGYTGSGLIRIPPHGEKLCVNNGIITESIYTLNRLFTPTMCGCV